MRPLQNGRHFCQLKTIWGRDKMAAISVSLRQYEAETKWPPFRRWYFQARFLEWRLLYFKWKFIEICSLWSNWQYGSIDSDNGFVPVQHQAIIWTSFGMSCWCIYASVGFNELIGDGQSWELVIKCVIILQAMGCLSWGFWRKFISLKMRLLYIQQTHF